MGNEIKINTDKAKEYASRLDREVGNILNISNSLKFLQFNQEATMYEKTRILRMRRISSQSYRINSCSSYLRFIAQDFEEVERKLSKCDPLNFKEIDFTNVLSKEILNLINNAKTFDLTIKDMTKIWDSIAELFEIDDPDLKKSLTGLISIFGLIENSDNINEYLGDIILDKLADYLAETSPGTLRGLGITAFITMIKNTNKSIMKGSDILINQNMADPKSWFNYFGYVFEHGVVDSILITADGAANKLFDIYKLAGVDIDLCQMYGLEKDASDDAKIDSYKSKFGEAYETVEGYVKSNGISKVAEDYFSYYPRLLKTLFSK